MMENNFLTAVYQFSDWIMKLAYVNILWIFFVLLGGVILGIGPATAGLFAVNRKMVMGAGGY